MGPVFHKTESKKMAILIHKPNKEYQNFLKDFYVVGKLTPVIDKQYSLNQVSDAISYLGEGHAKGKVVASVEINIIKQSL